MNAKTEDKGLIYQEINTSSGWSFELMTYLMNIGLAIKQKLAQVPKLLYPDNPENRFFSFLNTDLWAGIFKFLSPAAVVLNVKTTWNMTKQFYDDEKKTAEKTADLGIKILTTGASITLTGIALFGSAALLLYSMPYILIAAAGINALYGIFNIGKHIYRACKEPDPAIRRQHYWAIAKQALAIVVNTVAIVGLVFMGLFVNSQVAQLGHGFIKDLGILKAVGGLFKAAIPLVYAVVAGVTLGAIPALANSAADINNETLRVMKDLVTEPRQTLIKAGKAFVRKWQDLGEFIERTHYVGLIVAPVIIALELASMVINTVSRVAALVLSPFQWLGNKLRNCYKKADPVAPEAAPTKEPSSMRDALATMIAAKPQILPAQPVQYAANDDENNPVVHVIDKDSVDVVDCGQAARAPGLVATATNSESTLVPRVV